LRYGTGEPNKVFCLFSKLSESYSYRNPARPPDQILLHHADR
jgi:hypothetical protein